MIDDKQTCERQIRRKGDFQHSGVTEQKIIAHIRHYFGGAKRKADVTQRFIGKAYDVLNNNVFHVVFQHGSFRLEKQCICSDREEKC